MENVQHICLHDAWMEHIEVFFVLPKCPFLTRGWMTSSHCRRWRLLLDFYKTDRHLPPRHQQSITLEYGALPQPIPPRQDKDSANDNTELCVVYSSAISLCGQKEPPPEVCSKTQQGHVYFLCRYSAAHCVCSVLSDSA